MNKSKIAILFTGHLRSLDRAIPDWKSKHPEFYDADKTDVFCHTWSGENKTGWENDNKPRIMRNTLYTIDDLKQHMNVVSCDVEEYDSSPVGELTKQNNYIGTNFSQAYTSRRVYEMFEKYSNETNTKYDLVIKTRVDTFLGRFPPQFSAYGDSGDPQPLPIELLKDKVKESPDKVMVPWFNNCDHGGMTDQVLIGSKGSMQGICCLYIEWLQKNAGTIGHWHIETNFKKFTDHYGFNIERFHYNLGILRSIPGWDGAVP